MLGAMGLGLAMLRGKRNMRRYMMARMLAGGFGRGRGGYGLHGTDFSQMPLPPFIEARLKSWHDQAHAGSSATPGQASDVTKL